MPQRSNRTKASRRRFLGLSLFALFAIDARSVLGSMIGGGRSPSGSLKSFSAFVDTLLPADGPCPSGSALGVDRKVLDGVHSLRARRFLAHGCAWLDNEARRRGAPDFTALRQTDRDAIVATAATAPRDRGEYIFFDAVRADAFDRYYGDARSWPAVGYDGPPQPSGFPDQASPPKAHR